MDQGFCPSCGTPRSAGRFCASCGADLMAAAPAAPSPSLQAGMATGLYQLEQLRLKLIVGRLAGIAVGLALWWFVLGPSFGGDFIPTAVSLVVVLFGGLWVGQMVTLSVLSGRRG